MYLSVSCYLMVKIGHIRLEISMKLRFHLRIITSELFRKLTFKTSSKFIIANLKKNGHGIYLE